MSNLCSFTLAVAAVMAVAHGVCAAMPDRACRWGEIFPRSVWPGRVLSAIALAWAFWMLKDMPMGLLDAYKPWLVVAAPVTIGLTWIYLDELLAPRALGGILLLVPAPWLVLARLHPSRLSVVASLVCYAMIIKGLALVLSPYVFRKVCERYLNTAAKCRILGVGGLVFDAALATVALVAYR